MRKDLLVMGMTLFAILISGCMSEPELAPRYVQINLWNGSQVGGEYVSETAAFTTIQHLYTLNPDAYTHDALGREVKHPEKYFIKGNGTELSIENNFIHSMTTIENPATLIETNQKEMNDTAEAMMKAADEKIMHLN